jgi:sulfur-carrier protein
MDLQYHSWLRTRAGKARESVSLPEGVTTLSELVDWLARQNGVYEALFTYRSIINASVNGQMVQDWKGVHLKENDKISFFSPLAGG